jgi:hypothetical protein
MFGKILAFAFVAEVMRVGQASAQPDLVVVGDFTMPSCQWPTSGGVCPSSGLWGSGNWCVAPLESSSSYHSKVGQMMTVQVDRSCAIGNCFNQHVTVPGCQGGFGFMMCVPPPGTSCSPPVDLNGLHCNEPGCTPVTVGNACANPRATSRYLFGSPGKYGVTISGSQFQLVQFQIDVAPTTLYVPALGTWGLAALAFLLPLAGLLVRAARRTRAAA